MSVAKAAIEKEHSPDISRQELSGYYMAAIVSQDHGGMLIALPETFWRKRFGQLTPRQFAKHLRACATHVRPDAFRKNRRGRKKPKPKRTSGKTHHHVSTARLLAAQK